VKPNPPILRRALEALTKPRRLPILLSQKFCQRFLGVLVVGLYATACLLPAYYVARFGNRAMLGFEVLFTGFLGLPYRIFGWYANLLFFPALFLFWAGRFRVAPWLALAGFLIGLSSRGLETIPNANMSGHGGYDRVVGLGPGLYTWLAAFFVLTVSAFWFRFFQNVEKDSRHASSELPDGSLTAERDAID
jgi:hypothetical protein